MAKEYNDRQLIEEATLISQFWSETTSAFEGDDAGLFSYLSEWHRRYNRRGIPKLLDTDPSSSALASRRVGEHHRRR